MAKRALLFIAFFLALFSLGAGFVYADNHDDDDGTLDNGIWQYNGDQALIDQYTEATKRCDTPSLECLVFYTVNYTAIELTNSIAPIGGTSSSGVPINSGEYNGPTIAGRRGAVPSLAYLIAQMYGNPAASTDTYVADLLHSAGVTVAPPAHAQGLGFVALNPVLELWKTFRNIAYVFYVLIFVVIGFLIMLRQKIGHQQAITAQQAIPSIIVSLIFVTFSYAIAGFLIDLMYLSMFLIVGVFDRVSGLDPNVISYNIFDLGKEFISAGSISGYETTRNVVTTMIEQTLNRGSGIGDALSWVSGITVGLVVAVAVLIATFKLFFELLKSYANIVLMVVTAPIQLMMGAIPGRNVIAPWIKGLIGNLASFPIVLMAFIMFKIFVDGAMNTHSGGFMPPFLIGGGAGGAISGIMGLAILLAVPEIVKKAKEKMGVSGGFGAEIAAAGWARAKTGGGVVRKAPGKIREAQPFTMGPESAATKGFKIEGKETLAERILVGTRASRKAQFDRLQRQRDFGSRQITPVTHGGILGTRNKKRELDMARNQPPGAGAAVETSPSGGGPVAASQRRRRQGVVQQQPRENP